MLVAWLVENNIVVNIGVFETEEDAVAQGYVILDYAGADIGDDVSDLDALRESKANLNVFSESERLMSIEAIREKRNELLAETDWWTAADLAPMSEERIAYRQALRDLPSVVLAREPDEVQEGENGYCNVPFPVKPD